jgi:hypothetical protein
MAGSKLSINRSDIGWSADGRTLVLANYASFDLVKLVAGATGDAKQTHGPFSKKDDVEVRRDGVLRFEVLKGGKSIHLIKTSGGGYHAHSLLDSARMVAGTSWGDIHLYRTADGARLRTCPAHNDTVSFVAPSPNGKLVASFGITDRLACLWDPESDRPLLYVRIVPVKTKKDLTHDWLVWTPDGYYSCSPGAEAWFGWHLTAAQISSRATPGRNNCARPTTARISFARRWSRIWESDAAFLFARLGTRYFEVAQRDGFTVELYLRRSRRLTTRGPTGERRRAPCPFSGHDHPSPAGLLSGWSQGCAISDANLRPCAVSPRSPGLSTSARYVMSCPPRLRTRPPRLKRAGRYLVVTGGPAQRITRQPPQTHRARWPQLPPGSPLP